MNRTVWQSWETNDWAVTVTCQMGETFGYQCLTAWQCTFLVVHFLNCVWRRNLDSNWLRDQKTSSLCCSAALPTQCSGKLSSNCSVLIFKTKCCDCCGTSGWSPATGRMPFWRVAASNGRQDNKWCRVTSRLWFLSVINNTPSSWLFVRMTFWGFHAPCLLEKANKTKMMNVCCPFQTRHDSSFSSKLVQFQVHFLCHSQMAHQKMILLCCCGAHNNLIKTQILPKHFEGFLLFVWICNKISTSIDPKTNFWDDWNVKDAHCTLCWWHHQHQNTEIFFVHNVKTIGTETEKQTKKQRWKSSTTHKVEQGRSNAWQKTKWKWTSFVMLMQQSASQHWTASWNWHTHKIWKTSEKERQMVSQ